MQKVLEAVTANSAEGLSLHWERTKGKSPIVKLTAKLIDSLADHIPGPLRKHWALLDQYWDCSVPLIRNSLVSAMGKMLMMSSKDGLFHQCDGHDRRIQSFQRQALEMLMERTLDKSSYTRYVLKILRSGINFPAQCKVVNQQFVNIQRVSFKTTVPLLWLPSRAAYFVHHKKYMPFASHNRNGLFSICSEQYKCVQPCFSAFA